MPISGLNTHTRVTVYLYVQQFNCLSPLQIVDKALEEPKYSSLYAQLCLRLAEDAPNFDGPSPDIQAPQKQSTVSIASFA